MSRLVLVLSVVGAVLLVAGGWMTLTQGQQEQPQSTSTTTSSQAKSAPTPAATSQPEPAASSTSSSSPKRTSTSTKPSRSTKSSSSSQASEGGVDVPPAAQRATMITAARAFVKDLSATERAPKQWWSQIEPHLTTQAATDMKGMDPSWMPPLKLAEGGWVLANDPNAGPDSHAGELTAEVIVPTDTGKMSVTLRPDETRRTYKVMQYALPEAQ